MSSCVKKIGILAFADMHSGGVYQYTQSIVDALKLDVSAEYIVFCKRDDARFDNYELQVRKIDKPYINLFRKVVRLVQFLIFFRRPLFFSKIENESFKDIDMFISPAISAYPHYYLNKPFIFTLHDMQERYYPEFFSIYEKFIRWLCNRTLAKSATKIICESNFVKKDVMRFIGIEEGKISVIQSPPPEEFLNYKFDIAKYDFVRTKYNLPQHYIFYPAQAWPHKNHFKLIEAFELVAREREDVCLVLTGSSFSNQINIIDIINRFNLNERIKHLGYIDYKDLPYIYKLSQMLVMPTLFESVSIPIYEAFALEVAVCCSNVVALPDQVGNAGLIFNPHSSRDIAEKIMQYLNNNDLRMKKSKLGFDRVAKFNHKKYRKNLLEILNT